MLPLTREQIGPELVLGVRVGEHRGWLAVRDAQVPGVPAVATAKVSWGGLEDDDACPRGACAKGGRQPGIAGAQHHHVVGSGAHEAATPSRRRSSIGTTNTATAQASSVAEMGRVTKTL